MEWVESIAGLMLGVNGWVWGGILTGFLVLVGLYSTRLLAWFLIAALMVAHQDYWVWQGDTERSFFELPFGFVYHVGLSIVTAVVWWIVTMEAWPEDGFDQDLVAEPNETSNDRAGGAA
jgi:hypothetical protein